jgi:hypothetical protein
MRPGPHYQGDVLDILNDRWDAMIAHPVCRYLTNSGNKHLYRRLNGVWAKENGIDEERFRLMRKAARFFMKFDRAKHIPFRAVENPVMHCHGVKIIGRKADQYIQPWMFGSPRQKATGLWLTALPKLVPERTKASYMPDEIIQEVRYMTPSPDREEKRSMTDIQIARVFAKQWGDFLLTHH